MSKDKCRSPALSDEDEPPEATQDVESPAPGARNPPLPRRRLARTVSFKDLRAYLDLEAEPDDAEDAEHEDEDEEGEEEREESEDEEAPPGQAEAEAAAALAELEEEEDRQRTSRKRTEPEPVAPRMLLDEELDELEQSQRPTPRRPAQAPTPAPSQEEAVAAAPAAAAAPPVEEDEDPSEDVSNKNNKYSRWCFTWFPGDNPYRPATLPAGVEYMVFQEERGGHTEHLHLQGYLRFKNRVRFNQVLTLLRANMKEPTSLRVSKAVKVELACRRYCTKLATRVKEPVELGDPVEHAGKQGYRSDLADVVSALEAGKTYSNLADSNPEELIKYGRGIKDLIAAKRQSKWEYKTRENITVTVLYGPTNSGKTHRVWGAEAAEGKNKLFIVEPGRGPWDRYEGQEAVLFDEFGMGEKWELNHMKRLLDKYPMQLDCRYASNWAAWTRVYIISNDPPALWWMTAPAADKTAFWRRVTQVQEVLKREDDPEFDPELHCRVVAKPQF